MGELEQLHEFGRLALQSVLEGRADLATPADTPVMFAIEGGNPVEIVAMLSRSRGEIGIAARRDHGINRPDYLEHIAVAGLLAVQSDAVKLIR